MACEVVAAKQRGLQPQQPQTENAPLRATPTSPFSQSDTTSSLHTCTHYRHVLARKASQTTKPWPAKARRQTCTFLIPLNSPHVPVLKKAAIGLPPPKNREDTYNALVEDVAQAVESVAYEPGSIKAASSASPRAFWIAVCGAPASGKSTLSQEIGRRLNDDKQIPTIVVPMDGYHYYKHELDAMPDPEAMHARRGAPWTFNVRL